MITCNNDDRNDSDDFVMKTVVSDVCNNVKLNSNTLLVDCGATSHVIRDRNKFVHFNENFNSENHFIELADGSRKNNLVKGKEMQNFFIHDTGGISREITLKNALYVPSYNQNIFSVDAATKAGVSIIFKQGKSELIARNGTRFGIINYGKLYYLNNVRNVESTSRSLYDWHKILGHCNSKDLLKLEPIVNGMKITSKDAYNCETCVKGKMTQHFNRKPDSKANCILDMVHCDLTGNISPVGLGGYNYGISFVDDFSGAIHLYHLRKKTDSVHALEKFLSDIAPFGRVKCLRTDNGTEFTSAEFESVLRRRGIRHECSAPHSPHQNGTVERSWRTIFETARCLVIEAGLPKFLWPYAAKYAVYARNRCLNHRLGITAYEAFTGRKPKLAKMQIFGSKCFAYVQDKKKMDQRSEEAIFVGFDSNSPAYQVYFPKQHTVKKVRCIQFLEEMSQQESLDDFEPEEFNEEALGDVQGESSGNSAGETTLQSPRYPQRNRKPPSYLEDYVQLLG